MYYFVFGSDEQLFTGGWVRINADNEEEAKRKFIARYGENAWKDAVLNYAFGYTEEKFKETIMYPDGGYLGAGEHDYIP